MTIFVNAVDTYVSQNRPQKNFGGVPKIIVSDASGTPSNRRYGYIYFAKPVEVGETVHDGKLRLWSANTFPGAVTVTIRLISNRFKVNKVVWDNKPDAIGAKVAELTKTNAPAGTLWEFDVKDLLQDLALGEDWYGLRISATGPDTKRFYSSDANREEFRPELEVMTSEAPEKPTELYPRNNMAVSVAKPTLRWKFSDPAGDQTLQAVRVRLFNTKADADAQINIVFDSGQHPSTVSSYDLDIGAGYAGVAEGGTVWWRATHWDGAGLEAEEWSDPAQYRRTAKQAAAWTVPSAADPVVNDPTPPFAWTFPDQAAFQFLIYDPANLAEPLWDSGLITSTDRFHTPDSGVINQTGKVYRARVRLLDSVVRATLPDDDPWVTLELDFTYEFSATVAPPSSLTVVRNPAVTAWADLEWARASEPDEFILYRDGIEFGRGAAVDFLASAGVYRFTDRLVDPRREHTYQVVAVVNGVTSDNAPTATVTIVPRTTVLSNPDGERVVSIWNPSRAASLTEDSEIHNLLGDADPVLIVNSLRPGYSGRVTGVLVEDFGVDIHTQSGHMEWFRENTGTELRLTYVDRAMRIVAYNFDYAPEANADGSVDYLIGFDFFEVGKARR